MTQEEFNTMLATAIAQGLGGGYYTSVYSGEEIDTLLALTGYIAGDPLIDQFYIRAGQKSGVAPGEKATAEGANNEATGVLSHAEGEWVVASGYASHAEGYASTASGVQSHAEGNHTIASGDISHAEGANTEASGNIAHAEGNENEASGYASHAEGEGTIANHLAQHTGGRFNIADPSEASSATLGNYAEIIGNGTADNARSNARTLDWSGNEVLAGKLTLGAQAVNNNDVPTLQQTRNIVSSSVTVTDDGNGGIIIERAV